MRRTERFADAVEQYRSAFEGMQSQLWTSCVGVITAVDFDTMSCSVQPAVMAQLTAQDGTKSWQELPLLLDCPIVFPSGGGFTLTFPLTAGDECLVVFASRCIDNWWAQQGDAGKSGLSRSQAEIRMHDLSDGFAIPGPFNKTRVPNEVSATDVQLRSDEGSSFYSIQPNGDLIAETDAAATVSAEGNVTVTSNTGNIVATATTGGITATATAGAITATAGGDIQLTSGADILASATATVTLSAAVAITLAAPIINLNGVIMFNGVPYTGHAHVAQGSLRAGSTVITGDTGGVV